MVETDIDVYLQANQVKIKYIAQNANLTFGQCMPSKGIAPWVTDR